MKKNRKNQYLPNNINDDRALLKNKNKKLIVTFKYSEKLKRIGKN